MNPEVLNTQFGIVGKIAFQPFEHTIVAELQSKHATAKVSLYGAHVLSFIPNEQEDVLFVSPKAIFKNGKAIRGGIPICWPWFGPHPVDSSLPPHGFARISNWAVTNTSASDEEVSIELGLTSNAETMRLWPYQFEARLLLKLDQELTVELTTRNTDNKPFEVSAALHSYFNISDIETVTLEGLSSVDYQDDVANANGHQTDKLLAFGQRTDRRYRTSDTAIIHDTKRDISVKKSGSGITVVWNPGAELAMQMGDLAEHYQHMLCVEAANSLDDTIVIQPGMSHTLATTIS
ncbi:D-hexose-6-phosphate mutarotase [Carboxylicivirga sediminis]|uniref:Putative glucose-6-phosphate 1-epimerase n=1 Tax=Carboxylicivirga sediminis TaxID=2006564 RepID=A0A941F7L0_9BACT|nr:D-hexose-6-phosphate mutarotase [Carboxylicivirga sediminis]MBR8537109.1 D-hexose-6-phosphate mutarotase [Carboxylicivirga sediminis]